jgi:hypothetical protein
MNLAPRYNWITEELINQLEFLMRNSTAAMQARGKMILKKLAPRPPKGGGELKTNFLFKTSDIPPLGG